MSKKKETIEETLSRLNKLYGEGSILRGKEKVKTNVVPHASIGFNLASNIGGLPKGKLIQIEGNQHVGKSTFVGECIAAFQKAGQTAALFDYEYAFDLNYGEVLGINIADLFIAQPNSLEDGYEMIIDLIKSGNIDAIFIDSINMMIPQSKLDGEVSDKHVAVEARLHDMALKKIKNLLSLHDVSLIGISQYRDNIGAIGAGNDKTLAGGNAWKFITDFRIKISRFQTKKEDGFFINNIEIVKNKIAAPFRKEKWYCTLAEGTDKTRELLEYGKENDIITMKGGGHYSYGEVKLGQGIDNVRSFLSDNPELEEQILKDLYTKLGLL